MSTLRLWDEHDFTRAATLAARVLERYRLRGDDAASDVIAQCAYEATCDHNATVSIALWCTMIRRRAVDALRAAARVVPLADDAASDDEDGVAAQAVPAPGSLEDLVAQRLVLAAVPAWVRQAVVTGGADARTRKRLERWRSSTAARRLREACDL